MPGTLLTAVIGPGGGTVVVDDTIAVTAIASLTSAITANTVAINTTMGALGAEITGNVSCSTALTAGQTSLIAQALGAIEKNQQTTNIALDSIAAELKINTLAIASLASSLKNIDIMATTAVADQLKNNRFQQKATNAARAKAGDPPIEVLDSELNEVISGTLKDMKAMTAIQFTYKTVDKAVDMLSEGAKWTLEWTARTEVGLFFTKKFAEGQALIVGLYSKETAERILRDSSSKIAKIRSGK